MRALVRYPDEPRIYDRRGWLTHAQKEVKEGKRDAA